MPCVGRDAASPTLLSRVHRSDLLRRTFGIELQSTRCHGDLRLVALVKEAATIAKILGAMGLPTSEIGARGDANSVNLALRDLAGKDMHFVVASSVGLKLQVDKTHYDSASQREYGKRYADAWFKLTGL